MTKRSISKTSRKRKEGTTGIMSGFAIPHAKSQTINEPSMIIVTLNKGIEWNSLDRQSVDFIFALFIPDSEAGTTHLKLLSRCTIIDAKEVTEQLRKAKSKQK